MITKEKLLRKGSIIGGLLIIVVGGFISKKLINANKTEEVTPTKEAIKKVAIINVKNTTINLSIKTTGKLKAVESVDIYADVTGNLVSGRKPFKSGVVYKKGEPLLIIDDKEERLNLEYAKSDFYSLLVSILPDIESDYPNNIDAWNSYIKKFDAKQPIKKLPAALSKQEEYFLAAKKVGYQYLGIKKNEFTLSKYKVYAPFNGSLNETNINPGALVRTGQKLGTFINTNSFELEVSISVADAIPLSIGNQVEIAADNSIKKWDGIIKRIGNTIDESSQTLTIYISVTGDGLFQGMFLNASINAAPLENCFVVERLLLNKDHTVYAIENNIITKVPVTFVRYVGNDVILSGIKNGTQLLTSKFDGIHTGIEVEIITR